MRYLRTVDDVLGLVAESKRKLKDLPRVFKFIERRHGMRHLGNLHDMHDAVWVGSGERLIGVANRILGEIVVTDAYSDVRRGDLVAVFGSLEKGKVVDAILLSRNAAEAALKSLGKANP